MQDDSSDVDSEAHVYTRPNIASLGNVPSISTQSSDEDTDDDGTGVDVSRIVFSNFKYEEAPTSDAAVQPAAEVLIRAPAPVAQHDDSDDREDSEGGMSPQQSPHDPLGLPSTRPQAVSMDDVPPAPPGFGSGWLLGAAGRLADLDSPRRTFGQQGGEDEGTARGGKPSPTGAGAQAAAQDQEQVHEEELSRRFHQVVESADDEPVTASSNVLLESSVGGLEMSDLDDLLARLRSGGGLDMSAVARPSYLPPASSLFSDDEEDTPASSSTVSQPQRQRQPPAQQQAVAGGQAGPSKVSSSSAGVPSSASPGPAPAGPPPLAKFARPPVAATAVSTAPSQPKSDSTAGGLEGGSGAAKTVVVDLRREVAHLAQSISDAATAAKAAAAASAAAAGDSSSDDDGDDWMQSRKQIKEGGSPARPVPEPRAAPGPSRVAATAATATAATASAAPATPASQPAVEPAAKATISVAPAPVAAAALTKAAAVHDTSSTSVDSGIGTGTDDLLLATGARRSFFVSTSDLPGDAGSEALELGAAPADMPQLNDELLQALVRRHAAAEAERQQRLHHSNGTAPAAAPPPAPALPAAAAAAPAAGAAGTPGQDLKHLPPRLRFLASQQQQPGTGPVLVGVDGQPLPEAGPGKGRPTVVMDLRQDVASAATAAAKGIVAGGNATKALGAKAGRDVALSSSMCDTEEDLQLPPSSQTPAARLPTNHSVPAALRGQQGVTVEEDGTVTLPAGFTIHVGGQGPRLPTGPPAASQPPQPTSQPAASAAMNGTLGASAPATAPNKQTAASHSPGPQSLAPAPAAVPAKPAPPPAITPPPTAVTLPRLPAWLEPAGCLTLAFTSPQGLPSTQVASLCRWLLAQQASGKLGASVVSLALCDAPASHPLLAGMSPAPSQPPSSSSSSGGPAAAANIPMRRLLLAACVPGQVDVTRFNTMGTDPQRDALKLTGALRGIWALLEATTLSEVFGTEDGQEAEGSGASTAGVSKLSLWSSCCQGVDVFVSAASTWSLTTGLGAAAASPGGAAGRTAAGTAAGAAAGAAATSTETFVCTVARAALVPPAAAGGGDGSVGGCLLAAVVQRAAAAGLSLVGMQTLYLGDEAAAYMVQHTTHRPQPFQPLVALALSGRPGAAARWHASLGPPDPSVARKSDPRSLHALLPVSEDQDRSQQPGASPTGSGPAGAGAGGGLQPAFACSYGTRSAAFDLALMFHQALDYSAAAQAGGSQGTAALSPKSPAPASAPATAQGAALGATTAGAAAPGGLQWLSCPTQQSHWVALPGSCLGELLHALWLLQHLAWCGFALRTLLRAPAPHVVLAAAGAPPAGTGVETSPSVLLVELGKEECREQLLAAVTDLRLPPLMLAGTSSSSAESPAAHDGSAGGNEAVVARSLLLAGANTPESSALAAEASGSPAQLPSIPAAAQLLLATRHLRAACLPASRASDQGSPDAWDADTGSAATAKSVDRLVCVALQGRNTQELLLLALEVLRLGSAQGAASGTGAAGSAAGVGTPGLELVALRLVRQLPHEASLHLTPLPTAAGSSSHASAASAATTSATGRSKPAHRLQPGQPCLLLALNGPEAGAALERGLASLASLASGGPGPRRPSTTGADEFQPSAGASGFGKPEGSSGAAGAGSASASPTPLQQLLGVEAMKAYGSSLGQGQSLPSGSLPNLGSAMAPGAQAQAPLMAALTTSVGAARAVLAHCFQPQQVALDPTFHDGVSRPLAPTPGGLTSAQLLLAGPLPFSTVLLVALDAGNASPGRTALGSLGVGRPATLPAAAQLPRLFKLLHKEDFTVVAIRTCRPSVVDAALMGAPGLAGKVAAVLWLQRSNAVLHLHNVLQQSGLQSSCVVPCPSAASAEQAVQLLWPPAQTAAVTAPSTSSSSSSKSSSSAPHLKRIGGSELFQVAPVVLLPPASKSGPASQAGSGAGTQVRAGAGLGLSTGAAGGDAQLDWGMVAEVLEGARAEGFAVVGVSAPSLYRSPTAGVSELSRLLKLPAHQAQALAAAVPSAPDAPPSPSGLGPGSQSPHPGTDDAAAAAAGGNSSSLHVPVQLPAVLPPTPLVALALARENASAHLAMRLQASAGRGLGAAGGALAPVPSGRSASEQQLVQLFEVLSDGSGHIIERA